MDDLKAKMVRPTDPLQLAVEALETIRKKLADCERLHLIGKTPDAKLAGTLRNVAGIANEALTSIKEATDATPNL